MAILNKEDADAVGCGGKCADCGKPMSALSNASWEIVCPDCFQARLKAGWLPGLQTWAAFKEQQASKP